MLDLVTPSSIKTTLCSLSVSQSGLKLTQKPGRGRFIGMWVDPSSKEDSWKMGQLQLNACGAQDREIKTKKKTPVTPNTNV